MGPISDILHHGAPWAVSLSLAGIGTGGTSLVTPASTRVRGPSFSPVSAGSHDQIEDYRIILLGFHYDVVAATEAGFDLFWGDLVTSPGGTTERIIVAPRNADPTNAARLESSLSFTFVAGIHGNTSPRDAASLQVRESGASAITSGNLLVWGIYCSADQRYGFDYTLSPVSFSP